MSTKPRQPVFTDLRMGTPSVDTGGFVFVVRGWARWERHGVDIGFRANLDDDNRLRITSLEFDAPTAPHAIGRTMLREFPMGELLLAIRQWAITDGEPNDVAAEYDRRDGYISPLSDRWQRRRPLVVETLSTAADGLAPGRKRIRNDDYLQKLATEYVRLAASGERKPRDILASQFGVQASGIATTIRLARDEGWLAPVSRKGARNEIAPGRRLRAVWSAEGHPDWYTPPVVSTAASDDAADVSEQRRPGSKDESNVGRDSRR